MIKIIKKEHLTLLTLSALITNIHAEELAIIANYKPNCINEQLTPISLTVNAEIDQYQEPIEESETFQDALKQLRQDAATQGADIILLTHVKNFISKKHKKSTKSKMKLSTQSQDTIALTTELNAQLFTLCENDKSLSDERTIYNQDGYEILTQQFKYTLDLSAVKPKTPIKLANTITLPPAHVSFSTGVYGISLGTNTANTAEKLGPPSIVIALNNQEEMWGYGRNLWFSYSADKLTSISSEWSNLNSSGKNSIGFRSGFDDIQWLIDGVVPQNSQIEQVRNSLSQYDIKENRTEIIITEKNQSLKLKFEAFHPEAKNKPELLLTHFTLTASQHKTKENTRPHLTPKQVHWLYEQLQPKNVEKLTLMSLLNQIPQTNKINIANDDKQWWLVGDNVFLQFNDNTLSQAHIKESIFKDSKNSPFLQSINSLQLPLTKQGMLASYKDAIDNYNEIEVSRERFNMIAKFESETGDAAMYDLIFTYY